ncbi:MAG: flagellar hook protein FlgE [Rhodocyclales bacterium GT-UBC]|nr:MAG: flagellar hook protein FlgE [Rhodocyclales bacterium GT-UBC]
MAFQQGLSGLNTASKALDVTSNNIANASTVGFKTSATHFADVYAASLSGGGASQVGIGSSAAAIVQQYTQGNITTTSNSLDIAINGAGFYRTAKDGAVTYTRNGQFHADDQGYLVNDSGANLTGYLADANGSIIPTTPTALKLSTADIAPQVTGSTSSGVQAQLNLDSTKSVPASTWVAPTGTNTPQTDTYNFSTATTIYDTLGNAHTMTMYFEKTTPVAAGATGAWNVHYQVDGTSEANVASSPVLLEFNSTGKLITTMPVTAFSVDLDGVATDLGKTNNAAATMTFNMSFTGTTQYGSSFSVSSLTQDGYAAGHLAGLSIGKDGVIQGNYSNGQSRNLAQIVLANFTNPNGLMSVGNNGWIETAASGQPLVGAPNTGTLGVLQSGAVEESNVDLTGELVNMIVQQRNYQASAQSIKTQDQIMQTMVNLK